MNNKAQFYIFTALVLCSLLIFIAPASQVAKPASALRQLHSSYKLESSYAVNNAILTDASASDQLHDFTQQFILVAEKKQSGFGIVYLFKENDKITVYNYLDNELNVSNVFVPKDTAYELTAGSEMFVVYDKVRYDFVFSRNVELKGLIANRQGLDKGVLKL